MSATTFRVFIAEDSILVLSALQCLLKVRGMEVAGSATHVDKAAATAATIDADIAILDIHLHGKLIFPVADILTRRGMPIIFVSASIDEMPARFRDVPFVPKPFDPVILIDLIGDLARPAGPVAAAERLPAAVPARAQGGRLGG